MPVLSKDIKLLTLSLILRTLPQDQQRILKAHFSPEVVRALDIIEKNTSVDIEKLDWTPFYQSWPDLKRILNDCKREIEVQRKLKILEEQRPRIKDYMQSKLGAPKKGPPVLLSKEIMNIVDQFLTNLEQI